MQRETHRSTQAPISLTRAPSAGPRTRAWACWGVGLIVAMAITLPLGGSPARAQTPAAPRETIEAIIREYLLSHPDVIVESLQRAEQQRIEAARSQSRAAVQTRRRDLLEDPGSPVGGNPAGDVTVVEFFDYRCPHCRRMAPVVKALLAEDRGIRLVYKELPILGEESTLAARAALAARGQGKYVDAHDRLLAETGPFTRETVVATLAAIGLDAERLRTDMDAPEIATLVGRELSLARALGIDGTPAFVVGGELVVGAVDLGTLRELVRRARSALENRAQP